MNTFQKDMISRHMVTTLGILGGIPDSFDSRSLSQTDAQEDLSFER